MFEILCDNCGEELVADYRSTLDEYNKDMDYIVEDIGKIVESSLQQYLVYTCMLCDKVYKFTYKDWERRYRERLAMDVMEIRKREMFKAVNPQSIDPDNGLEYCGQCSGYAGDGNCLVDIIKQCTIRKDRDVV